MDTESQVFQEDRERLESLAPTHLGRTPRSIEPLMAGLGTRRFYRLRFAQGEPRTVVARFESEAAIDTSSPAVWLPEPELEPLRTFLEEAGLPVPRSHAHLPEIGLDLLEDVGDRTLGDADPSERPALYRQACALVPRLQALAAAPDRIPAFGRIFDRALLSTKLWKWLHWTIPGLLGREARAEEASGMRGAFDRIAALLDGSPRRLSHRDYKAENLHLPLEPLDPARRLVMIDVQGAFLAPPEYDLVCLLYDLQVELDEAFVQECFRTTLEALPDVIDPDVAAQRFDALAVARLCKDVSHLVHAARERDDTRRWHEIPRGLSLLTLAAGRLAHTLPEIRALHSVIPALSDAVQSSDSPPGRRRGP